MCHPVLGRSRRPRSDRRHAGSGRAAPTSDGRVAADGVGTIVRTGQMERTTDRHTFGAIPRWPSAPGCAWRSRRPGTSRRISVRTDWLAQEAQVSVHTAAEAFLALCRLNCALFGSLSSADRAVPLSHPEYGSLTVDWVIHQLAGQPTAPSAATRTDCAGPVVSSGQSNRPDGAVDCRGRGLPSRADGGHQQPAPPIRQSSRRSLRTRAVARRR